MAVGSTGSEVCAEVRLSMKLRYLSGGTVWYTHDNFGVSVGEFYRNVFRTVDAINKMINVDWYLDYIDKLIDLERGFGAT